MKIAVSGDCFAAFTSGFPVRGMILNLIKQNPNIEFVLLYTKKEWPKTLEYFYSELHSLPNIKIQFFKDNRIVIALKRMLLFNYVYLDESFDCFINPGHVEYITNFKGPQICSLADLSTVKGLSTSKNSWFYKRWNKYFYKKTLPKLSKIVAISNFTKKDIVELFPKANKNITVVYNGIDNFWFDEKIGNINLGEFGINGEYFIWWGYISRRKNIGRLIAAYNLAKRSNSNIPKLLIVGNISEYMSDISDKFNDDIINIPFQDNYSIKYLVKNSSGLIFPSLYEGFGLPVIEAFSQGVNVACSNVTSLPEVAGGNAILFDPLDINDIAKSILKLTCHEVSKDKLINYASRFSYEFAAMQYLTIIKSLI